jgi:hypothetical protein
LGNKSQEHKRRSVFFRLTQPRTLL